MSMQLRLFLKGICRGTWGWRGRLLRLAAAAVLALATACGPLSPASRPLPEPVTEDGMTLCWGPDIKNQALSLIRDSHRYCWLDIYELSDPDILSALADARRRGVDTRVVVDAQEQQSQTKAVPTLQREGVPVASLYIAHGISHIKMLVTDAGALMGGMNFGEHSWDNNDASVKFDQPDPSFWALFQWDWARAQHEPKERPSLRAPVVVDRDIQSDVVRAIQNARQEIDMEAFNLSDWDVIDALVAAAHRGVTVQVLLDPGQSQNRKTAARLRDAGVVVRFYRPYGNEWMHAKILDVDGGSTFIIGSANFTHQAYTYNHEGDLVLHDVPAFHRALVSNLSAELSRGTAQPVHRSGTDGEEAA
jgi:cardiolipin synthase